MSDEAFLHAIFIAPDDDRPRLVNAGYLSDRGDPRVDFIRVQCELARLPDDDPRRTELEAWEQALPAEHRAAWLGALRPLLLGWTFRRGFVEEIVLDERVYEKNAAMIHQLAPTIRQVMTLGGGNGG